MTVDKAVLDGMLMLSSQLSRQAFGHPPVEGWLNSFLTVLCERFASLSVTGARVAQVIGNTPVEMGSAGAVPAELPEYTGTASTADDKANTAPIDGAIRSRQPAAFSGGRVYPIPVGEDVVGVMVVYFQQPDDAIDGLLGSLAVQLGPALMQDLKSSRPQTGRLIRQIDLLRSLQEAAQAVSSALDSNEVLSRAARSLHDTFPIDHVGIVVFDSSQVSGTVVAENPDNGTTGMKVPVPEALYKRLHQDRAPVAVNRIEDAASFGLDRAILETQGIRSVAYIPMFVQNELVGAVSLDAYFEYHDFTAEELDGAMAITSQLAISIRNAQLYNQIKRQAEQLESIAILSRRITTTFNRVEIFGIVREETNKLVTTDLISVALRDLDKKTLDLTLLEQDGMTITSFDEAQAALRFVCASGEPLVVDDISGSDNPDFQLLAKRGANAVMAVPLIVGGRVIGTYNVAHHQPGFYSSNDVAVLEQVGNQLVIALENARLYAQTAQRAEAERLMNKLSGSMQRRGNLQDILLSTVQEMAGALGATRARVRLQTPPALTTDSDKLASLSRLATKLSEKADT